MIVPLTSEEEWLHTLEKVPSWQPPSLPALIVSPHPDDETLATGGLIAHLRQQGIDVQVAAVTDGEAAYPNAPNLAATRHKEQQRALAALGVPPESLLRFGLPDSNVAAHESALAHRLTSLLSPGMQLFAPWPGDFHPDHEACARAALSAAHQTSTLLTFYFFWTWHRGTPSTLAALPLLSFPLSERLLQTKANALACHASQLLRDEGEPILPERLLAPARRPFEVFAAA